MIAVAKPYFNDEEVNAVQDVIRSGWVTQGPKVQEFEEKFAQYVGSKYAVAVSNCTTALHLSLIVAGVSLGDEVICPSMSFIATANAIKYVGATPVFCDVGEDYNIDPDKAEKLITKKTKAILIVHQIGMPADIDRFTELGTKYNIKIIEDAACAAGSSYKNKKIGSHSSLVCFSFHPRKVISTGEGGMITTSNKEYSERLKRLRQHGMSVNDRERHNSKNVIIEEYNELGFNFRMTDIQAAIGIKQLEKLDYIVEERRKIAKRYHEALGKIDSIVVPLEQKSMYSNYQSYSIYLKMGTGLNRNEVMKKMLDAGISTRRGIMTAHRETVYKGLNNSDLSNTDRLSDNSIILPLYVPMDPNDIEYVIDTIQKIIKSA